MINLLGLIIGIIAFTLIVFWIKARPHTISFTRMPMISTGWIICSTKKIFLNNILHLDQKL